MKQLKNYIRIKNLVALCYSNPQCNEMHFIAGEEGAYAKNSIDLKCILS